MNRDDDDVNVTHVVCDACWPTFGFTHRPTRVQDPNEEHCCWCGRLTRSGIYRSPLTAVQLWCGGHMGRHYEPSTR